MLGVGDVLGAEVGGGGEAVGVQRLRDLRRCHLWDPPWPRAGGREVAGGAWGGSAREGGRWPTACGEGEPERGVGGWTGGRKATCGEGDGLSEEGGAEIGDEEWDESGGSTTTEKTFTDGSKTSSQTVS